MSNYILFGCGNFIRVSFCFQINYSRSTESLKTAIMVLGGCTSLCGNIIFITVLCFLSLWTYLYRKSPWEVTVTFLYKIINLSRIYYTHCLFNIRRQGLFLPFFQTSKAASHLRQFDSSFPLCRAELLILVCPKYWPFERLNWPPAIINRDWCDYKNTLRILEMWTRI